VFYCCISKEADCVRLALTQCPHSLLYETPLENPAASAETPLQFGAWQAQQLLVDII
jgi:hypothetical protein